MYKNQLQELAQRSCFNLPSYTSIREGPDHAPRFKAAVNFNGEVFESPGFCTTLRQAEHSAAEAALTALSHRGPSHSLAARILDETGVYKNLLQEVAQRVGAPLPSYETVRSGLGHLPVFTCTVELAGVTFTGDPAKNKKQAEKNAASQAWAALKQLAQQQTANSSTDPEISDELEQIRIARALLNYRLQEKIAMAASNPNNPYASPFPKKFPIQSDPSRSQSVHLLPTQPNHSKILPLIQPRLTNPNPRLVRPGMDQSGSRMKFNAAPYVPVRSQYRMGCGGMAPPVNIRMASPVYSAPPVQVRMASPVRIRMATPVFQAPPVQVRQHGVPQVQVRQQVAPPVQVKDVSFSPTLQIRKHTQTQNQTWIQTQTQPQIHIESQNPTQTRAQTQTPTQIQTMTQTPVVSVDQVKDVKEVSVDSSLVQEKSGGPGLDDLSEKVEKKGDEVVKGGDKEAGDIIHIERGK